MAPKGEGKKGGGGKAKGDGTGAEDAEENQRTFLNIKEEIGKQNRKHHICT